MVINRLPYRHWVCADDTLVVLIKYVLVSLVHIWVMRAQGAQDFCTLLFIYLWWLLFQALFAVVSSSWWQIWTKVKFFHIKLERQYYYYLIVRVNELLCSIFLGKINTVYGNWKHTLTDIECGQWILYLISFFHCTSSNMPTRWLITTSCIQDAIFIDSSLSGLPVDDDYIDQFPFVFQFYLQSTIPVEDMALCNQLHHPYKSIQI